MAELVQFFMIQIPGMSRLTLISFFILINISLTVCSMLFGLAVFGQISYFFTMLSLFLFSFTFKLTKLETYFLIKIILFFILPILVHYFFYLDATWFKLLHYIISIFVGLFIARYFIFLPFRIVFIIISLTELSFIIFISIAGDPENFNRTYLTVPLCAIFGCICIQNYLNKKSLDILCLALLTLVSILSYSRSVSLLCFFVFIIYFISILFRRKTNLISIFGLLTASSAFLVIGSSIIESIMNLSFTNRIITRGLDSGRFFLWAYYFSVLDVIKFFIGVDSDQVNNIIQIALSFDKGGTLHNSFLQLHSHGGIVPVIWVFSMVFIVFRRLISVKGGFLIACGFAIFIGKATFDSTILPQRFDYLFFAILFALNNMKFNIRDYKNA